ncbi:RHS repeat-associated core domain-containing protein [Chryseobacterium balustinum]|uniref:RHS repeat-associated core domain-containing protein n=1 Tax=Chryseobacterium balustinum TaxID=246 RepID=A0ABY1LCK0_9FLAO|nr:RHS repeat-associated core domain-containing protein [Chryseobacterium balustinum]
MYDYGARMYMPDIGRWGVVDPLAEKHPEMTPYRYSFNNPINATDPTGLLEDWVYNTESNSVYWNENATSQATAGANETYLGTSGTYTTESDSTTALHSDGSYTNNSLLGGFGIMNNLDPLIHAGDAGPAMSYMAFGDPNAPTVRETPASNSPEVAMGNPSGQLAVAGLYGLQGAAMEIGTSKALGVLAKIATTSDGFLFGGVNMNAPINIPTQRFGNIATDGRTQFWGLRIGTSEFANRTAAAIKPEWNPLTQYTSGIIPKGTPIKVGIIGPQAGGFYTGGSLQFITNSNSVINKATKTIPR